MAHILIVDDEKLMCEMLSDQLSSLAHATTCAHTLANGLKAASESAFDLVLLDVRLPDGKADPMPTDAPLPDLKAALENAEKRYLETFMLHTRGEIKTACRISGLSRSGLYETALGKGEREIILADYRLPRFDGMSALRLARERCPRSSSSPGPWMKRPALTD